MPLQKMNSVLVAITVMVFMAGCGRDKKTTSGNEPAAGDSAKAVAASSASAKDTSSKKDSVVLGPVDGVPGVTVEEIVLILAPVRKRKFWRRLRLSFRSRWA